MANQVIFERGSLEAVKTSALVNFKSRRYKASLSMLAPR